MAKRNRYDEESIKAESTEEVKVETVEDAVVQTEAVEEKVEESTTKKLEDMTDAELLDYMNKRRAEQAAKYAIKEVKLPMHILVQKTVTTPTYTDNEMRIRNRMNRLQRQLEQKGT